MKIRIAALCALLFVALCTCSLARGQSSGGARLGNSILNAANQSEPEVAARVTAPMDEGKLVQLTGNTHPLARTEFDRGTVYPGLPMERMILVLQRSKEQEAALRSFMARQLDPASQDYRHWLQPSEFGTLYGPAERDIQTVSAWLELHGFTVDKVAAGRMFLEFSGTAGMVEQAFHTSIHRYNVNGQEHIANSTDPSIPEALRPVVAGVASLNDFRAKPAHIDMGSFRRDPGTGKWSPEGSDQVADPLFGVTNAGTKYEMVTPYDFATIYNVTPLWSANIDGSGQTIAIAGRSNISLTDVAKFRSAFGLPAKAPTIYLNGADPGMSNADDRKENTLDVEWAGAVAKGATVELVTTKNTATTDGAVVSALYIVDNVTAPIMSFSYGECELFLGTAQNTAYNNMWQQGAAEGISIFVSSGDSGAAGCEPSFRSPTAAVYGLAVNGAASTPYNVAVGGTDLIWANLTTTYWNSTNAANGSSAIGYIPEVPWNNSCASDDVDKLFGLFKLGYDEEGSCNYMMKNSLHTERMTATGGGGGVSSCTSSTSSKASSCSGGYSKPSWQTGTSVPADGKRDIPDLSLFASNGGLNSGYLICDSLTTPCTFTDPADTTAQAVGGTSVASPAMAGIMALVLQKAGGVPQGLPNPTFYKLAAKEDLASCSPLMVNPGNNCVFYDIVQDNNASPCAPGTPNCTLSNKSDSYGILSGYKAAKGFDLATGLGSVNAANLVNAWSSAAPSAAISIYPPSLTFPSTKVGSFANHQTITLTNTGAGWLSFPTNSIQIAGTQSETENFSGLTTCTAPVAPGSECFVSVSFAPLAAGIFTANVQIGDNAPGSPQKVKVIGTGVAPIVLTLSQSALSFYSTNVGSSSNYQSFYAQNTSPYPVTFGPILLQGANASSFIEFNSCPASLAGGASCWVYVAFRPVVAGQLNAVVSLADSGDATAQTVTLSGTAQAAPTVTLSPKSLTFPSTTKGAMAPIQTVTLTNTGTSVMELKDIEITGPGASSFIQINNCLLFVSPSGSCTIQVAFQPAATGTLNATLTLIDNGAGTPQTAALTGTGK
ncbi:MAG: choice-of-anchor D domain-containing protein [Terracidiphilus sp.]